MFGRKHAMIGFAIEYLLNDRILIMLYQLDQQNSQVSCTDISSSYAQHIQNRKNCKPLPYVITKEMAFDIESYVHGTLGFITGRNDLQTNWINWALRGIGLLFENLEFREMVDPSNEPFHHYQ
jgi:hypothetical protein